ARDFPGERLARRYMSALARGEPASLTQILRIDAVLAWISNHRDPAVRAATQVPQAGRVTNFRLGTDAVIPSLHWVNSTLLEDLRTDLRVSRTQLSRLVLGADSDASLIESLESGTNEGHSYRITRALADRIYLALQLLYEQHGQSPGEFPGQTQL